MKTIMVDMDDVLTSGKFEEYLEEFLGEKKDIQSDTSYYRQKFIKGREQEFIEQFQFRNLYEDAPLFDGCFEVLQKLNQSYDIYIVTSYIWKEDIFDAAENLKNKFRYLQSQLPFIPPQKYIFMENKNMIPFDIKIDDRMKNLENASQKLLFTSWSNKEVSTQELQKNNITRVNNWYDIEKLLLEQ